MEVKDLLQDAETSKRLGKPTQSCFDVVKKQQKRNQSRLKDV